MQPLTGSFTFNFVVKEYKVSSVPMISEVKTMFKRKDSVEVEPEIEKWVDRICLVIVTSSALYFIPVVLSIFAR